MKDPGAPKIHELIHRVALCSQKDIVVSSDTMELRRTEVVWAWARIRSHYGLPTIIGVSGYSIWGATGKNTSATHAITVRAGLGVLIASTAYVYEEFRKSPPRWYKVLGFAETDDFLTMPVRLVERSDYAISPHSPLAPQQSSVKL